MAGTNVSALLKHFELPPPAGIAGEPGGATGGGEHGGGYQAGASADWLDSFNPDDGSLLGRVRTTSSAGYDTVMSQAVAAARSWADVPAPQRGELVRQLGDELRHHKRELAELVALENGKIIAEALGEVQEMIDIADLAIGQSRMLYGRTMHSERSQHRMYEQWHPLGVVGIITAFNFPVAVWSWNALLAAVCGNAWSGSRRPKPRCARWRYSGCAIRCSSATARRRFFNCCSMAARELGSRLAADRRVGLLSFTGSTAVGRQIAQTVAARLGRSLLELGGNNAIIVDETRRPRARRACHRLRRAWHRRPALHHHAPRAGASLATTGAAAAGWCMPTDRCESAIRSTPRRWSDR